MRNSDFDHSFKIFRRDNMSGGNKALKDFWKIAFLGDDVRSLIVDEVRGGFDIESMEFRAETFALL